MVCWHFLPGGGMPGVTGRDGRPLEGVEETELFQRAFPGDGEGMRLAARGAEPADAARLLRWEAGLELARRALAAPRRPVPLRRGRVRTIPVPALRFAGGGVRRRAPRRQAPPPAGGARVVGDPRRQPHPPERGVRRGGPGTRRGGPPAAQPPERRSLSLIHI